MKSRALVVALALVAVGACSTSNRASVELRAVCATTDDCKFQSTCTNTLMGEPAIDAAQTATLWVPIEAANQLPDNSTKDSGQLNTHDAHVDTFVLDYGDTGLGTHEYSTNQTVPTNGTTVLGVDVFPVSLNAQSTLQAYAGTSIRTAVVKLKLKGYYDDGERFETGTFPIAVQVCQNCIGPCPAGTTLKCPGNLYQYPRTCLQ